MFTKVTARPHVKALGGFGLIIASVMCLSACSDSWTEPEKDIPGRLATAAAADGPPSYFLGQSFAGIDLTAVDPPNPGDSEPGDGYTFFYGTCKLEYDSGGCLPPIQVQNFGEPRSGADIRCPNLISIRGVPAEYPWDAGIGVYTGDRTVVIYPGDNTPTMGLRRMAEVLRRMAKALRPVSGPADLTKPLPPPSQHVLAVIARKCGPGHG